MAQEMHNSVQVSLKDGGVLRVAAIAPHTFRIRLWEDEWFGQAPLVRYNILSAEVPQERIVDIDEDSENVTLATFRACLSIDTEDGQLSLEDNSGGIRVKSAGPPWSSREDGFGAEFELVEDERLYGLGDVTRDRLNKRGYETTMWVENVESYVPIPYLMSSRGWAILINTTWRHHIDVGASDPNRLQFHADNGRLDYFLFIGDDLAQLLDRYTNIAGKPQLLPIGAYGLTFVCNQQADARDMLDNCLNFRREDIPCDYIGLEPGWMSEHYDYSVDKEWHPERFYLPEWSDKGPDTFLAAADRLGFKLSLWLCCDYDLSFEEERRAGNEMAGLQPIDDERSDDDFEQDEHFAPRRLAMDNVTKPEEPWFDHLKKFVDQGVSAFKMDGSKQVMEHPDRKWGNGMDDEEMHNLYPTILNKQMHVGFKDHTGRRPMIYSSGGYTGIQQYAATWAGDTGGEAKPLASMLNHAMSGHSNTSCDMHVFSQEGIHFGFLQAWSQLCSWAYWRHPWYLDERLLQCFKRYAKLRYKMIPYIYSMAHIAAETGMPIMRPMPLAFPEDRNCDDLIGQYMLGDNFLVSAFADEVYLPEGEWFHYWTGSSWSGPMTVAPDGRREDFMGLFVRGGAIHPLWPEEVDYAHGQQPQTLPVHAHLPATEAVETEFTVYEDDGESFDYLDGELARTHLRLESNEQEATVEISPREGSYPQMPPNKDYEVWLYRERVPETFEVNGTQMERGSLTDGWIYIDERVAAVTQVSAREENGEPTVVRASW